MLRPCVVTGENRADFLPFLPAELTEQQDRVLLLGLEEDGLPCGLLAGTPAGETFELRSLYVDPAHRRRGGGLRLLEVLISVLEDEPELKKLRCVWQESTETEGAAPLFRAAGFAILVEDGTLAAELPLSPVEDLGSLLADISE
ncbi:MAG: GNAT family N-acetyltransferase [Ruminococcaceae bacterium]|nr:GNAT family N-acetyltransferase [Oscillospiraceae bacterium]